MARDFAESFYKSKVWKRCRRSYIKHRIRVDGGLCEICHERTGYIVHHKIELTPGNINDPSVSLGICNLQFVCLDCHNNIHGVGRRDENILQFDANGDPIPPQKNFCEKYLGTGGGR